MRIGINLLYLLPGLVGGTETYAAGLLNGLSQIGRMHEFVVFVNEEAANWPIPQVSNFSRVICPVKAIKRSRRYFFEQFRLGRLLIKYEIDVVHSLGYVGPLRTPCPSVVTLPDLNYRAVGQTMPISKRYILQFFSVHSAQRADAIITISNFSKIMICNELKIKPEKVTVTHLAPRWEHNFISEEIVRSLQATYGISSPYLVAFGGGALHKNIPRLLCAFPQLRTTVSFKLVLIGSLPDNVNPAELSEDIITTGYIPAEHVLALLSGADVFVFPSLYEGFGLPVVEAQQMGVPVACSTAGSLPEVAGDAALFFDPYSIVDLTKKVAAITSDPVLSAELRQKGFTNILRFSWVRTAEETMEVYEKVYSPKK